MWGFKPQKCSKWETWILWPVTGGYYYPGVWRALVERLADLVEHLATPNLSLSTLVQPDLLFSSRCMHRCADVVEVPRSCT